jgi:hypothetical protein
MLMLEGDFKVVIPHMYIVYFEKVHPPPVRSHSLSLLTPFSSSIWLVLLCCPHTYIWSAIWSSSPLSILSFPLPSQSIPQTTPFSHHVPLLSSSSFRSTFHRGARTCGIWFSDLGLSHSAWWSIRFSANDIISFFFMAEWYSMLYISYFLYSLIGC